MLVKSLRIKKLSHFNEHFKSYLPENVPTFVPIDEEEQRVYDLLTAAASSQYDRHRSTFERIAKSFRFE